MNLLKLCALVSASILLNPPIDAQAHKRVVQISIPKCGTHLVNKCLQLLGCTRTVGSPAQFVIPNENFAEAMQFPDDKFMVCHLIFKPEYVEIVGSEGFAPIFIYRDPRDHVVSYAYHMKKRTIAYPKATHMTIDDIITDQLTEGSAYAGQGNLYRNVNAVYMTYLPWMTLPNVLVVTFEDLVGARGGGSDALQLATIKKIAGHVGMQPSDAALQEIVKNLFGPSMTFREGKIGSWKKHFTLEQKRLFKEVAGQLLIDLGYEKDMNW